MKHLNWLVTLIVVLVLVEGALVAAVLVDPDVARDVGNFGADMLEAWVGDEEETGIAGLYARAADDAFATWVLPLWSSPSPPSPDAEFSDCLGCHAEYADRPRSATLYIDHPTHATLGIGCRGCHTDTVHPNPLPPSEETCATCHAEVDSPDDCQMCHAPGTLAHYEMMGVPRDGFVDCATCHLPGSFSSSGDGHLTSHGAFNGTNPNDCMSCHTPDWCSRCHGSAHSSDWMDIHGQSVAYEGQSQCIACHSSTSCAACHSREPKKPLPIGTQG